MKLKSMHSLKLKTRKSKSDQEKIFSITQVTKDLPLKYVKNPLKITKKNSIFKNEQKISTDASQ